VFTKTFWIGAFERLVKTFCQTLLALLSLGPVVDPLHVNWVPDLSYAGLAAFLSLLTSLVSISVGPPNSPSVVSANKHEAAE
jgi:hypothetical protein